ncbi:MAG TPA: rhodanese-like domain-containing protein [Streptosporangiaceae bacterium]|nr:rhodanese-like domain-containing protein [Streptosporangiaceae bacterium]
MTADPGAGQKVPAQVLAVDVPPDARLVDVREPKEWAAGHAPGATHIPLGDLSTRYTEIPQDGPVYLICRSGARSNRAANALAGAGWDALNVSDGMQGWAAAGRAMTNDSGAPPYVA